MNIVFHITKLEDWERGKVEGEYKADTLESVGFIHCSTAGQLIKIANNFYGCQRDLLLLCIDLSKVRAEIKFEGSEGGERYPHIYGPLNIDSVIKVLKFELGEDGKFKLPGGISNIV
ncbi:MAG: DUF952 domain-containing protein [Thermodesulfobacteriota bacterium]